MQDSSENKKLGVLRALGMPVVVVFALAIGMMILADRFLHNALDKTILSYAEQMAQRWTHKITTRHPELARVQEGQAVPDDVMVAILESTQSHNIFRFKLFSPEGLLLIVSNEPMFEAEGIELGVGEIVRDVFDTNVNHAILLNGSEKPNRPDTYVEAYIRAKTTDGQAFGVIEVYVDVTEFADAFHEIFYTLTQILIFGSAVAYLIPSLFYIFRREKIREQAKALLHLSRYDPLTNTLNRRAFSEKSDALFKDSENKRIGVVFLDLDRFKQVNDSLGHEFGDALLKHVAGVLTSHLRDGEILTRVGGDEFIILSPNATEEDLLLQCETIRRAFLQQFSFSGSTITFGVSIGVHVSPFGETEPRALHCADLALYRAKTNGRGKVVLFSDDLDNDLRRRRHVEASMRKALAGSGNFFMEFQPIFGFDTTRPAGFEALLRMHDVDGQLISPAEFIPIAEESGLMHEIGALSLEKALEAACRWPTEQFLAINLSAIQFKDGDLVESLKIALERSGFEASRLHLEVTESMLIEDEEHVSWQLSALKNLGVSISLDDFGTGYSSIAYLCKFQFDTLKIDRSFLASFDESSPRYRRLISTIINLGQNFNMDVVVEGVETESQLSLLKELQCDFFQGFLLGRPLPETVALNLAFAISGHAKSA